MHGLTAPPFRHVLVTADAVGGVWTQALDLARGLVMRGGRVTLAVLGPAASAAQRRDAAAIPGLVLRETALPLDWLASREEQLAEAGAALAELARATEAEALQLHAPALAAATRFPCPVVGVAHSCLATWWRAVHRDAPPGDFGWRTAWLARGYRAVDALLAPTRAYAAATAAAHGLATPPTVVRNGCAPGARGESQGRFVLTAGRLWDEGKNLAALDRAAARLDAPVLAAGPVQGPNGAAFAPRRVRLLGTLDREALRGWMLRGPVFASVALYEPFGLAVLEAAQAGCPLVLSDIPTFRELWDGAAIFVPPRDDAALAAVLAGLLGDEARRRALSDAAARRARACTADAMTEGVLRIHALLRARQRVAAA